MPGRDAAGTGEAPPARTAAFVGRQRELAAVVSGLAQPAALVLVEGEAGIGKTRLVRECLDRPPLRSLLALELVCPPLPDPFPLGPLVAAVQQWHRPAADLALSPLCGALRPLLPEWGDCLPPPLEPLDDPRATRHRLFRALSELLEGTGVELLVVEDAHWADLATLEFLLMLLAAGRTNLRTVVTYRPTDVPPGSPLLRLSFRSSHRPREVRVAPEPLSHQETRALVASMCDPGRVSDEFVAFLRERTGGVPLALEESFSLLRDRGDLVRRDGQWTRRRSVDRLRVPPTVRDSVRERAAGGRVPH